MKIYELKPDSTHFHNFCFSDDADAPLYREFRGVPMSKKWAPVGVSPADTDEENSQLADYCLLGVIPLLSARACAELHDVLEPNGELLPVVFERAEYFAFNVTRILDVLDKERSSVIRYPEGNVMYIANYVFREEEIRAASIFKLPELPKAYVFVTEHFVERVLKANLTGFSFKNL